MCLIFCPLCCHLLLEFCRVCFCISAESCLSFYSFQSFLYSFCSFYLCRCPFPPLSSEREWQKCPWKLVPEGISKSYICFFELSSKYVCRCCDNYISKWLKESHICIMETLRYTHILSSYPEENSPSSEGESIETGFLSNLSSISVETVLSNHHTSCGYQSSDPSCYEKRPDRKSVV